MFSLFRFTIEDIEKGGKFAEESNKTSSNEICYHFNIQKLLKG
jgi:hypothetical protein